MKRVMITGATGLIGSHTLAARLGRSEAERVQLDETVAVAHSENSWEQPDWLLSRRGADPAAYTRTVAELEYMDDCRRLLHEHRPEIVFHCAARVSVGKTRNGEQLVRQNVALVHNLITAALELPAESRPLFVHVSSIAALGHSTDPEGYTDEQTVMDNLSGCSAYARSKFLSENEVWRGAAHGLRVVAVNPAVVIGAMSPRSGFWLNGLFRAVRRGGHRFWIDGEAAFVAADDVARAMLLLAERPETWGKRYILSAGQLPYRQFLGRIARIEGRPEPRIEIPRWLLQPAVPFVPALGAVLAPHARIDGSAILRALPSFRYSDWTETLAEAAESQR